MAENDLTAEGFDLEASMAEADRILSLAGWRSHPEWEPGQFAKANLVGGIQPDGQGCHFKDWTKIKPGDPRYSADTPDTPHEAAQWLVDNIKGARGYRFRRKATLEPPSLGADILAAESEAGESAGDEGHGDHPTGESEGDGASPEGVHEAGSGGGFVSLNLLDPIDADFTPVIPAITDEDHIRRVAEETATDTSGVAYFGDNLHVIRLAKIGRVTQVAAEKKAALQFGWDVAEFAYLTNLIVRMDQGLAPDDPTARSRFALISDASRAMSAVDAFAETQVGYLNAASREEVEAFDPEAGWPS